MLKRDHIAATFRDIQKEICEGLEKLDGKGRFVEDSWNRDGGGGGFTRIIEEGNVIEKGGVNFSEVHGELSDQLKYEMNSSATKFYATGVSIVIHPKGAMTPIIHMNIRYFEMDDGTYWFGGGIDLTPHYIIPELAGKFHRKLKAVCDEYNPGYYKRFKEWADDYFYLSHRNETRGVGGIFFDQLNHEKENCTQQDLFDFVCTVGRNFVPAYEEQVLLTKGMGCNECQREWQLIRRGRYVEFNLVHDRGTRFGLLTNGRTESILMSLPKDARWLYNHHPAEGTEEKATLDLLRKGIDWKSK